MLQIPISEQKTTASYRGRSLAHVHLSASQRAAIAAGLVTGEASLVKPTIGQAATLMKVCPAYVVTALKAGATERAALAAGRRPITDLLRPARDCELERQWQAATPEERQAFARRVGVAALWDDAISPTL
jgi:hypothetical protein